MNQKHLEISKQIGARIRASRQNAKLSQEQLAARAALNSDYISRLELGKENPTIGTLILICQCLNIDIGTLFTPTEK